MSTQTLPIQSTKTPNLKKKKNSEKVLGSPTVRPTAGSACRASSLRVAHALRPLGALPGERGHAGAGLLDDLGLERMDGWFKTRFVLQKNGQLG